MQLTKLEMYGFKSFSNRTKFTFSPGITSFVGPNGCGKSNVVDAIRWVLGEQNPRAIRASKMEDVIFVGSDQQEYKNFAEVSIVLDNSSQQIPLDYSEITITRRLYKSGESEYYLNRVPCRLKDINEVLATTSLAGGSYAIIGQGQVEEVIHSRPDDRRQMFEQAAGITLYKIRKREAARKLADTRANLTRVDDIIHELESQKEEIADSAHRARRYLALKQQADQLELNLWALRYNDLSTKIHTLRQEEQQLAKSVQQQKHTLEGLEGNLAASASRLDELNGLVAVLEQNKARLADQKSKMEYQQELARQRRQDIARLAAEAEDTSNRLRQQLAEAKETMDSSHARSRALDQSFATHRQAFAARDNLLQLLNRMAEAAEQVEKQAEAQVMEAMIRESKTAAQRQGALQQMEETRQLLAQVESETKQLREKLASQQQELAASSQRHRDLTEQRRQLMDQANQMASDLADGETRLRQLEQQKLELKGKLEAGTERISMLRQMDDEFQGYAQGPRAVLRASSQGKLQGIVGSVAQLVSVKDPRHNLAIETALGAAMQYVVCSSEEDCKQAIEMLKRSGQGRATFIPLSVARRQAKRDGIFNTPIIGRAEELIEYDQSLTEVVNHLLGNVLVVADLDKAMALARGCGHGWRIVTLEGELVSRGLYTGGNWSNSKPGLLQRREVQARLEQANRQLANTLAQTENELKAAAENISKIRQRRQLVVDRADQTASEAAAAEARAEQDRLVLGQLEQTLNQQLERKGELENRLEGLQRALSDLDGLAGEENLNRLQQRRDHIQRLLPRLRDTIQVWAAKRNRLQLMLVSLKSQADNVRDKTGQFRQRMDELAGGIERTGKQVAEYRKQCADLDAQLSQLKQALADNANQADNVAASLGRHQQARQQVKEEIDALNRSAVEARDELHRLQTALHDADVKLTRWETEQQAMIAELGHKLGLTVEQAVEQAATGWRQADLNTQVKKVRSAIEDLGQVNLASIQQHDRLEQRLEFLINQRRDLVSAEKDITDLIQQLNDKIKELFLTTFSNVQQHFATIFSTLFGGGEAYLSLTDQDDVLETGVEIYARPPGKRTQSLSLLSGGEKAMTAIALLFALQSARPSPFCILDEIEAALDDVNIIRFARYVRKLAESTQFVLITHRRETMEHSDTLYGITLSADGASKPVSVTLNKTKGDASEAV